MVVAPQVVRVARRVLPSLLVLSVGCERVEKLAETPRVSAMAVASRLPPPGEVVWTKTGDVLVGTTGEFFRLDINEVRNSSLVSRLNSDGTAAWERSFAGTEVSISQSCIYEDELIVEQNRQIQALDPLSGREKWSLNPNAGILGGGLMATVYCFGASSDYIAIVAGKRGANSVALIRRTTGKLQWNLPDLPFAPYPVALFSRYLVVYSSAPGNRVLTLDAYLVGADQPILARSLELPGDTFFVGGGAYPRLYACYKLRDPSSFTLARIEPTTITLSNARVLEDEQFPSLDGGRLRLDGPNSVAWLDATTLATIWSYRAPVPIVYTYAALATGRYLMSYASSASTAELAYLDPWAPKNPVWVRSCPTVPCSASGDLKGGAYLTDGFTLHALNADDGTDRWTYVAPRKPTDDPEEAAGGVEDVIDVDASGYYVLYRGPGYKCPPMGVAALVPPMDIGDRAVVRWEKSFDRNVAWVGSDGGNLHVSLTECAAFGTLAAIKK